MEIETWSVDIDANNVAVKLYDHSLQIVGEDVVLPPVGDNLVRHILSEEPSIETQTTPGPWIYDVENNTVTYNPQNRAPILLSQAIIEIKNTEQQLITDQAKAALLSDETISSELKAIISEL